MKKTLTFCSFYIFCFSLSAQQPWNTITPSPDIKVSKVVAPDSLHLKALMGSDPWDFIYSNDGGTTWISSPVEPYCQNLFFSDAMNGWIGSDSGKIFHT